MTSNTYQDDHDLALDNAFQPQNSLQWTVRESHELQDELNRSMESGDNLTLKTVHRVVDRIKDL